MQMKPTHPQACGVSSPAFLSLPAVWNKSNSGASARHRSHHSEILPAGRSMGVAGVLSRSWRSAIAAACPERRRDCRSSASSLSPRDLRPTTLRREDLRGRNSEPSLRFAVDVAAAAAGEAGICGRALRPSTAAEHCGRAACMQQTSTELSQSIRLFHDSEAMYRFLKISM